jgi:hypothetical protein
MDFVQEDQDGGKVAEVGYRYMLMIHFVEKVTGLA